MREIIKFTSYSGILCELDKNIRRPDFNIIFK